MFFSRFPLHKRHFFLQISKRDPRHKRRPFASRARWRRSRIGWVFSPFRMPPVFPLRQRRERIQSNDLFMYFWLTDSIIVYTKKAKKSIKTIYKNREPLIDQSIDQNTIIQQINQSINRSINCNSIIPPNTYHFMQSRKRQHHTVLGVTASGERAFKKDLIELDYLVVALFLVEEIHQQLVRRLLVEKRHQLLNTPQEKNTISNRLLIRIHYQRKSKKENGEHS